MSVGELNHKYNGKKAQMNSAMRTSAELFSVQSLNLIVRAY